MQVNFRTLARFPTEFSSTKRLSESFRKLRIVVAEYARPPIRSGLPICSFFVLTGLLAHFPSRQIVSGPFRFWEWSFLN
jgi:hypothetical protein